MTIVEILKTIARDISSIYQVNAEELLALYDSVKLQAEQLQLRSSRPYKQIEKNCWDGVISETGLVTALKTVTGNLSATRNPRRHNPKDVLSYGYDIDATFENLIAQHAIEQTDDYRLEVKKVDFDGDIPVFYFNYNPENKNGLDLTTFINKGHLLADFLVLVGIRENTEICGFDVKPKYIIRSDMFIQAYKKCEDGESYLTHKIDLNKMIEQGHAIKIQ